MISQEWHLRAVAVGGAVQSKTFTPVVTEPLDQATTDSITNVVKLFRAYAASLADRTVSLEANGYTDSDTTQVVAVTMKVWPS